MGITRWTTWQIAGTLVAAHIVSTVLLIAGALAGMDWLTFVGAGLNVAVFALLCAWLGLRAQHAEALQRQRDEALGHTMSTVCKALGVETPDAKVYYLDLVRRKSAG